jgi:hypothetical protein
MIYVRLVLVAFLLATSANAQSVDEIKKSLTPTFRSLPDLMQNPKDKGVTIIDPATANPPSIDLHIPFEFNSDRLMPDAIII